MADQQQVKRLREGITTWNTWRIEHLSIPIDLSGADFSKADLSGAFLDGANLIRANFSSADLSRASFSGANLSNADFSNANLTEAFLDKAFDDTLHLVDFRGANFSNANLNEASLRAVNLTTANFRGANLRKANLRGANLLRALFTEAVLEDTILDEANLSYVSFINANLSGATFRGTDLSHARIGGTQLGDRDLRTVKGLETVEHKGPSPLSINTIYLSEGDIPEGFVKGTGAPDSFIEYMHALARKPIQYYTCFLSYTNKDQDFAERLYADLQSKGIRCWYAQQELKAGDYYRHEIDESIRVSDKLLVILSQHSIHSDWVEREVNEALKKEEQMDMSTQVLFPLRLDETVMHTRKEWAKSVRFLRHILDFTNWQDHTTYQKALARLLRDLRQSEKKPPPSSK